MTPEKYDQLALNVAQTMDDIYLRNVPATVLRDFARRLREEWMNGLEPIGEVVVLDGFISVTGIPISESKNGTKLYTLEEIKR